jgi:hypothetical protein
VNSRLHHRQGNQTSTFFSFKPSNVQTLFPSSRDHPIRMGVLSERSESKDLSCCQTPLSCAFRHSTKNVCPERALALSGAEGSRMRILHPERLYGTRDLSPLVASLSPISTAFIRATGISPLSSAFTKKAGCRISCVSSCPLARHAPLVYPERSRGVPHHSPSPFFSTIYKLHCFTTPLFSHSYIIARG